VGRIEGEGGRGEPPVEPEPSRACSLISHPQILRKSRKNQSAPVTFELHLLADESPDLVLIHSDMIERRASRIAGA
jgi:hypothetical protein